MLCRCNAVLTTRLAGRQAPMHHVFLGDGGYVRSEFVYLHRNNTIEFFEGAFSWSLFFQSAATKDVHFEIELWL